MSSSTTFLACSSTCSQLDATCSVNSSLAQSISNTRWIGGRQMICCTLTLTIAYPAWSLWTIIGRVERSAAPFWSLSF